MGIGPFPPGGHAPLHGTFTLIARSVAAEALPPDPDKAAVP